MVRAWYFQALFKLTAGNAYSGENFECFECFDIVKGDDSRVIVPDEQVRPHEMDKSGMGTTAISN